MRQSVTLGRLFDIRVVVHVSWLVAFAFMVLTIAGAIDGVSRTVALSLAGVCALLVFVSVIAHEFAHALTARRFGVRTTGITLFLLGGVATLECEPPTPRAELTIALAGPAMSGVLAALGFGALMLIERTMSGALADGCSVVAGYVALANGVLAVFNVIPAFPMDGGRVLRAAIWQTRKSRAAATGAASLVGIVFATAVIVASVVAVVALHAWRDLWYVALGAFVLQQGWVQLADSRAVERLERVCVRDMMDAAADGDIPGDGFSLAPSASALDAVRAFRTSSRAQIAVVDAGRLTGWLRREPTLAILERAA